MPHVDFPQSHVRFAASRADITPPLGIYWRMWGAATHDHATGVHRPLTATAAVFEPLAAVDAGGEKDRLALVSLDHCLLGKEEAGLVISAICNRCSLTASQVQGSADALVPAGEGWAWNQALMELGATVCTARSWSCDECPVRQSCAWKGGADGAPDPAIGSAGVSGGQSRFAGSDRQGRGRLVDALRSGSITHSALPMIMGWPHDRDRAERVAATLVRDELIVLDGDSYRLP